MKTNNRSRLLSWLLVVAMVLTMLPTFVLAADAATYTKITTAEELTSGQYVMLADSGYAPTYLEGAWVLPQAVSANGNTLTGADSNTLWTLTVNGSSVQLTDSKGQSVKPKGGNTNGISAGAYDWDAICEDGTFVFKGTGSDTVTLACNTTPQTGENRFRAYKNTTISGSAYYYHFSLYKLTGGEVVDPDPIDPVEPLFVEGDQVVIYNPANAKALSTTYNGFYNNGTDVTIAGNEISGYTDADIWTVGVNDDGSYTFSTAEGKKLSMGESFTSTPLDDVNTAWKVLPAKTEGCYYIQNAVRGNYLEWYASKNNWSSYSSISDEALFAQAFYKVENHQYAKRAEALENGDQFVIFYDKDALVLTNTASSNKLAGEAAALQGDFLEVSDTMAVLTAALDGDGHYTFTNTDGKYLTTGATGNSLTFADTASEYSLWDLKAVTGGFHIVSANAVYNGSAQALEVYNSLFTTFSEKDNDFYLFNLYKLTDEKPTSPGSDLPVEGAQVVIFNKSAQGVLAGQDDNAESPSIENAAATVTDGVATASNGALVFTVEKNGEYYRFVNETYGYLCSNDTGNNAFYQKEASEDADWTLAAYNGGFTMESRTAKFNGKYSQFMEYYAGAYKTYSMYNVTDEDIYTFLFYPCGNETITEGIVNVPTVAFESMLDAFAGQDYTFRFTVEAVFGVKELSVSMNGAALAATEENGVYTVTIPAASLPAETMNITVSGKDNRDVAFTQSVSVTVKDEPVIDDLTPAAGAQTGDNKRPVISASVSNAGENPTVAMTVAGETVKAVYADGRISYTPAADLADGRTSVTVTVTRADGKTASKSWSFIVGESTYQLYFGQLHSHTSYSDGSGSLDTALEYIGNLPESANVDFVAFTDHSNYFDKSGAANPEGALYDMNLATAYSQNLWKEYKSKVETFNNSQSDVIALGGYEMTWSGGPGHINTWNTPGIVSRNNTTLNNKTADAGMKAYYALLSQAEGVDSISQFNHPGTTFGNFTDFSYWDALIDSRIYLVEVGNGEGQIGAGGYYPSYEQYTMALDKGWHVAPTNNQDNHKGRWGNANDARDVILTDDFSEQGLYEAIRQYRVYATEDKNLEINYTVNGALLGSSFAEKPEKLDIQVTVFDPDASDSISKVEVIVNSGKVAYTWDDPAALKAGELQCTLNPDYSYYYIRVTQGDGDLAVTAPVWVGETLKLGISSVECGTATPVTGEELTLTTTLFNSESTDATIKSVTYTTGGSVVLGTQTNLGVVPASSSQTVNFQYTPTEAKVMNVTVTVVLEQDGQEYSFSQNVTLDVLDADKLVYIGIDASHQNEYVAGNYKDSMGNFGNLAAGYSVRTVQLNTSEELIEAAKNADGKYKMIILTAPSRRDGTTLRDPYSTYSDAEIEALVAFNKAGGVLTLTGWSDFYESYKDFPAEDHMAAQQNKLLAALGSNLRVSDDGIKDDTLNGGQPQRLYFSTYNFDSFLLDGVEFDAEHPNDNMYSQRFSHYGGASIYAVNGKNEPVSELPGSVTPVVYGHATTYSEDQDKDGLGGASIPKYAVAEGDSRILALATEYIEGQGLIIVSGAAFMSNFEVQATISDSNAEKNYSNYNICENLVAYLNPVQVTDIAAVQAEKEEGVKFTIEGIVTSNASGYDKDTAFFDCIYLQDETAGINAFPVAGNYKIGDLVRITGTTSSYQGERQIAVSSIELISENNAVKPTDITAKQLNDLSYLGSLVTLHGTVESFELANGLVQTILVRDNSGELGRVFIDGYITTAKDVENLKVGAAITVTGLASYDNSFDGPAPRLRIRNRADVVCTEAAGLPFTDVPTGIWYYDAVSYLYQNGIVAGKTATTFAPQETLTRGQMVAMLYRMEGEPTVESKSPFTDVDPAQYYAPAIAWAYENKIAYGMNTTEFAPGDFVTREQMVAFLARYAAYKGKFEEAKGDLSAFPDAGNVDAYAVPYMAWAVEQSIVHGNNGKLLPRDTATRAEASIILYNYCYYLAK